MGKVVDTYTIRFTLRRPVKDARYIEVGVPWLVVEREAKKRNLTITEFLNTYDAEAQFNNFEGILYKFVLKEGSDESKT